MLVSIKGNKNIDFTIKISEKLIDQKAVAKVNNA